jgi:iron-sulfur cluster repair protein YtfE (RIC family)
MQMHNGYRLKACEVLYNEHRAVNAGIAVAEPQLRPGTPDDAFARSLAHLVALLGKELPPHFAKEEEALFPVMESVTGQGFPPIEVMKAEHKFLIEHFEAVRKASTELVLSSNSAAARSAAARHVSPLIGTLEDHIVKEDSMLLVMASDQLEGAHDAKILRVFDEIDREGRRWA